MKKKKKVSSGTFFRHPAGPPETDFFLDWPSFHGIHVWASDFRF